MIGTSSFAGNVRTKGTELTGTRGALERIGGLTFYKDYRNTDFNADYSIGNRSATFAASRGSSNPATYFDSSGVMQKTETSNAGRFNYGYYDTSGWTAFSNRGLMIEGASTNYLKQSLFAADGNSDGIADSWASDTSVAGSVTWSLVDASSDFNVGTTVNAQRWQYTGEAGDDGTKKANLKYADTAAGSFVQNDVATISFWIKGSLSGSTFDVNVTEADVGEVVGTSHNDTDILTLTDSWVKYTYSFVCVDADCDRLRAFLQATDIGNGDTVDVYIACPQIEKQPFATSFIPTTTAALTRNAETLKYEISGNRTAATESCVVKVAPEYKDTPGGSTFCRVTDTDTKRRMVSFKGNNNDVAVEPNATDNVTCNVGNLVNEAWVANKEMTLGYNMQSGTSPYVAGFYNGVADGGNETSDDFTANAWGTYFWVGSNASGQTQLFGTIFSIAFWDRVLDGGEHTTVHNLLTGA